MTVPNLSVRVEVEESEMLTEAIRSQEEENHETNDESTDSFTPSGHSVTEIESDTRCTLVSSYTCEVPIEATMHISFSSNSAGKVSANDSENLPQQTESSVLTADVGITVGEEHGARQRKGIKAWMYYLRKLYSALFGKRLPGESNCSDDFFQLDSIPRGALLRVISFLSLADMFKMTLVCKSWRCLMESIACQIKRAEYPFSRFRAERRMFRTQYDHYLKYEPIASRVINWCCVTSTRIEVLILYHPINAVELSLLLKHCQTLKRLEIIKPYANSSSGRRNNSEILVPESMPTLEELNTYDSRDENMNTLLMKVLETTPRLRVLTSPLPSSDLQRPEPTCLLKNIFDKLIALNLKTYTIDTVTELNKVPNFQLKYFGLGDFVSTNKSHFTHTKFVELHQSMLKLLPKMRKLEAFVCYGSQHLRVSPKILALITELQIDLKFTVFWGTWGCYRCPEGRNDGIHENTEYDLATLVSLKKMLLSIDPVKDLSKLIFVMSKQETLTHLRAKNLGFKFTLMFENKGLMSGNKYSLRDPIIRQYFRLGL